MTMTDVEPPVFVDTNVLINANIEKAPEHEAALSSLRALYHGGSTLWISRQIIREYIVNMTRKQGYLRPIPITRVIKRIRYFQANFRVAEDTAQVTENLLALIQVVPVGGKQIHDANIVATMQANNINYILTLNGADFNRFSPSISVWSPQDIITRYIPPA